MCAAVDINTCGLVLGWDKVNRRKEHDQVKSCEVFTMSKTLLKRPDLLFTESEVEIIPHGSNYLLAVTHAGVPGLCISVLKIMCNKIIRINVMCYGSPTPKTVIAL